MTIDPKNLDNAFALAHRASEDGQYPQAARNIFRAIARQIWLGLGEGRPTAAVQQARQEAGCTSCGMTRNSVHASNAANGNRSSDPICCEVNI